MRRHEHQQPQIGRRLGGVGDPVVVAGRTEHDLARVDRDRRHLEHLRRFALPVIAHLATFPAAASWGDWLDRLETLAPMVLAAGIRIPSSC